MFSPQLTGYHGHAGPFERHINIGPMQPPQRIGPPPLLLSESDKHFNDLEAKGVFKRPEDIGMSVEYLNPSFLVKKNNGGFLPVTAFSDVGR